MENEIEQRKALAAIMAKLHEKGLISVFGGNASVRLADSSLLITPSGINKEQLKPQDVIRVSPMGELLEKGKKPSSELRTHLAVYGVRHDVVAVLHAHPPTLVGLVSGGLEFGVYTPEQVVLVGQPAVLEFCAGGDLSSRIGFVALNYNAVVVKNHGLFCWAKSLIEAYAMVEILEEVAKMVMSSHAAGHPMQPFSQELQQYIERTYRSTSS